MTEEQLTIVVVPDGVLGDDVQSVATAWSRAGLLQPSVWLSPSCIDGTQGGPARVLASLISGATVDQTDLFTLVGRRRLSWVRLLVVHLGTSEPQGDDILKAAALQISEMLRSALPLGTSEDERGTELHRVTLVVPANGVSGLSEGVLQPDWEVNAVVSPEDRPDVDRSSIFVREDSNYVGHVVNAICAVGGLWDGMPSGALDGVTTDSTTSEGWLHVLRPTVRAILADDRTEALVRQASLAVSGAEVVDFVDWGRRAHDPEQVVARAAEAVLSSSNWATPAPVFPVRAGRERRSAGDVAGAALRYNLRLFGTGWRWMVRSGERSLERVLTGQLVGHETDIEVALRPQDPASLAALTRVRREAEDRTVKELLQAEGRGMDVPAPEAWRDLRRVTFALIDGDELPEGIRSGGSASLVEVVPRQSVVPEPGDVIEVGHHPLGVVDVLGMREEVARLELAEAAEESARSETADATEPREDTEGATAPAVEAAVPVESVHAAERQRVRAWERRRAGSLLWLMAEDLGDRLNEAVSRRDRLEALRSATSDDAEEALTKAYGRLVNTWRTSAILGLVGVGVLVWAWFSSEMERRDLLTVALLGLVVLIAVVAFANHRYFKADLRFRKRSADAMQQRRSDAEELVTLRRNITWLEVRYRGLMIWAPILAELVHRPWGEVPKTDPLISAEDIERLPAAVAIAVRADETAETFSSQVVTDVVNVLCPPGFLGRRWDEVFEGFLRESGRPSGASADLVDSDELTTRASPRYELLRHLTDGPARSEGVARSLEDLEEAIRAKEVRLPPRMVRRLGRYSDGEIVTEDAFYRASLRSATPFTLDLWSPEGQQKGKHLLQRSLVWTPLAADEHTPGGVDLRQSTGRTAVRVDLSGRCYVEHVVLFSAREKAHPAREWQPADIGDFN